MTECAVIGRGPWGDGAMSNNIGSLASGVDPSLTNA